MPRTLKQRIDDEDYYFSSPQHALIYPWVSQIIGVVTFFVLQQFELPIPYAAIMFMAGMCMGIAAFRLDGNLTQFHNSIRQWSDIDSQVLLLVFLPGLIFRDALEINVLTFQKCLGQLMIFAFPMVLVGTVLTAAVLVYVLPQDYFSWSLGLTVGSILASTDPVAVAAVLKNADAPPRLQMHIGGESMLNDGAAVVFYLIFSQQFLAQLDLPSGDTVTIGQGILTFLRMSLGGVAVGLVFAAGLLVLLYELDRRLDKENNVVQVAAAVSVAYMSYYVSEQVCAMSGVIACVTTGITTKKFGSGLITDPALMDSYLTLLEHLLNTLLFTLGGTVFGEVIANSDQRAPFTATDWGSLFLLYGFVMVIRVFQVLLFYPVVSRIGLSTNWKEMAFFSFAGLRGAVGIALALALDRTVRQETNDEAKRAITSTVVGLAGGVSFLTLLVNGTGAGWLLRKLRLTPPMTSRKRALRLFETSAREFLLHAYAKLRHDRRLFQSVPFAVIREHLPFLSDVTQESLEGMDHTSDTFQSAHRRKNSKFNFVEELDEEIRESIRETTRAVDTLQTMQCPEEVKTDVREIFLKMFDAAYQTELSQGGLDSREDNGFNLEVLRQSVVFAVEDCHATKDPLDDWVYTNMFEYQEGIDTFVRRFVSWFKIKFLHSEEEKSYNRSYQQLRIRVLRANVFIEAHRRAEEELRSYLEKGLQDLVGSTGMAAVDLENAILTVLEESKSQIREAEEWLLTNVPPEDLKAIRAHYMATILLHKLGLYVEKSVVDGRLKEKEGRLYLAQIDQRVEKSHSCTRLHDEDLVNMRRRRKQKSTETTTGSLDGTSDQREEELDKKRRRRKQVSTGALNWGSDRPQV